MRHHVLGYCFLTSWPRDLRPNSKQGTADNLTNFSETFSNYSLYGATQQEFTRHHTRYWAYTGGAGNGCSRQLIAALQTGEWDACADGSGDTGGTGSLTRHYWDCDNTQRNLENSVSMKNLLDLTYFCCLMKKNLTLSEDAHSWGWPDSVRV